MDTIESLTKEAETMYHTARNENRELTVQEQMRGQQIFSDLRAMKAMASTRSAALDAFVQGQGFAGPATSRAEMAARASNPLEAAKQHDAFSRWLATGERGGGGNFVITTGADSGALVPVSVDIPDIVRRPLNALPLALATRGYKVISTATAETLVIPVMDDTSVSGDSPAEDATADVAADPTVSDVTLGAPLFSSKSLWLSNTMILSVGFDLAGYLMPVLDKRCDLAMNSAFTTKLLATQVSGNTKVTASATAFTYDELVEMYHTLSYVYRTDAVWVVSDEFLQAIRLLKDGEQRPVFNMLDPLIGAGAIGMLMGCPVVTNVSMEGLTANQRPACLVSAECLKVRIVTNQRIARYSNVPTYPDQVGFRKFVNADAGVNAAGIAFLKMAAS